MRKKNGDKEGSVTAKVIQFPLALSWAITGHKSQGMNILAPGKWFCDLDSCGFNGQGYVMLGRIQNIQQLYLKWSYDPIPKKNPIQEKKRQENNVKAKKRLKIDKEALNEAAKISKMALNTEENMMKDHWLSAKCLKIVSLNVQGSLQTRLVDLEIDPSIYGVADIICVQETGVSNMRDSLAGYSCWRAGGGKNKGVAIYVKDSMARGITKKPESITNDAYQCLKLTFGHFDLITIYRASGQVVESFVDAVERGISMNRPTIICGDFNFDRRVANSFTKMLVKHRFKQIVQEPTHILGNCIDHVYHNIPLTVKKVNHRLHYPYYSDHEAVFVMIENV